MAKLDIGQALAGMARAASGYQAGTIAGEQEQRRRQMERLSALPQPKRRAVMEALESMLARAAREEART